MVCQKFLMTGFDLQASAGWEASLVCLQWQFNIYIILNENVFSYFDQSKNDEVYSQSCLHLIFSLRLDKGTVWSPILRRNFQRKYTMCNFNITIFYWIGPGLSPKPINFKQHSRTMVHLTILPTQFKNIG